MDMQWTERSVAATTQLGRNGIQSPNPSVLDLGICVVPIFNFESPQRILDRWRREPGKPTALGEPGARAVPAMEGEAQQGVQARGRGREEAGKLQEEPEVRDREELELKVPVGTSGRAEQVRRPEQRGVQGVSSVQGEEAGEQEVEQQEDELEGKNEDL